MHVNAGGWGDKVSETELRVTKYRKLNSGYFEFRVFVLFHPTPLRLQEIVAMHSIKLAMGSVGQKKLASPTRV